MTHDMKAELHETLSKVLEAQDRADNALRRATASEDALKQERTLRLEAEATTAQLTSDCQRKDEGF